jgi:hypothetical protein
VYDAVEEVLHYLMSDPDPDLIDDYTGRILDKGL